MIKAAPTREAKIVRKTKAQIGMLLADFDAKNRAANKLAADVKSLKEEIRALSLKEGTYGEMAFSYGTPREQLDQKRAKQLLVEKGIAVPMSTSESPLVIKPKDATK